MDEAKRRKLEQLRSFIAQIEETPGDSRQMPDSACPNGQPPAQEAHELSGEAKKAYLRTVDLCSHHDFSSMGMISRLRREGFPGDACDQAVRRAVQVSLIDDARWGEMRAAALMRKGMGIPGIERELRENGISPHLVSGWPQAFTERYGSEFARALHVVEKRPPRSKNPQASAYARLVRKGYSQAIALQASRAWMESR